MPGIKPFLAGMLAGGCISCAALQYHVVRSDEGMYLVPRSPKPSLTLAFADTRDWASEQWDRHPQLADALRANGAADSLRSDAGQVSRDELQDAMQHSPDDLVPFEADDEVDSGMIVNKPTHRNRDSIDGVDDPVATHGRRRNSGFLDDVRSELERSFGNRPESNDHTARHSGSFEDDVRDARQRLDLIGDDLGDDTFSDTLHDSSHGYLSESDDPYSSHQSSDEIRHRSIESDAGHEGVDSQRYVPAPKFDQDDEILNRFAPRSGASDNWDSAITFDDASWLNDPWAQTSHSSISANDAEYQETESSPGWTPTVRNSSSNHAISGILDRFNSAAGDVARETINRSRRAVTSPLQDRSNGTIDWANESIDESLVFDEDGLYSPFTEVDD